MIILKSLDIGIYLTTTFIYVCIYMKKNLTFLSYRTFTRQTLQPLVDRGGGVSQFSPAYSLAAECEIARCVLYLVWDVFV